MSFLRILKVFIACHLVGSVPSMPRMKENMKVAYFGDNWSGNKDQAREVLQLIDSELEHGDMIVHTGDLGCGNDPWEWCDLMEDEISSDVAYFATAGEGRSESGNWDQYTQCLRQHNEIATNSQSVDDYCFCKHDDCHEDHRNFYEDGIIQACVYGGILVVYAAFETEGTGQPWDYSNDEYLEFIEEAFEAYENQHSAGWKVCVFHFLKGTYTITGPGETSTRNNPLLDLCRSHGAMIVGGNTHSYARTHVMKSFEQDDWQISYGDSGDRPVMLNMGQSISIVSGLGGARKHSHNTNIFENHWAAAGTKDLCLDQRSHQLVHREIGYGALFCTYNFNGNPTLARCEFLEVGESTPFDQFYMSVQDMMSEIDYSVFDSTFSNARTPTDLQNDYIASDSDSDDSRNTHSSGDSTYRSSEGGSSSYIDDNVVEICHRPSNPDSRRTKTISWDAWEAHERHGDYLGPCGDDEYTLLSKGSLLLESIQTTIRNQKSGPTNTNFQEHHISKTVIFGIFSICGLFTIIIVAFLLRSLCRKERTHTKVSEQMCTNIHEPVISVCLEEVSVQS